MTRKTSRMSSGASPRDGSSSSSSFGLDMRARPRASICCSPPERVAAGCSRRSSRRGKVSKIHSMSRLDFLFLGAPVGPHEEILVDAEVDEDAPALGGHGNALPGDAVGGDAGDGAPQVSDRPARGGHEAADGSQQGAFPAPFAPTRVTTFSSGTWRVTFFSAWIPP